MEQQYRAALRWYPSEWRAQNEDAALGTLLDAAEERDLAQPSRRELVGLALHGAAARADFFAHPRARSLAATISIATGAGYGLAQTFLTNPSPIWPWVPAAVDWANPTGLDLGPILPLLWVAALIATLCRATRDQRLALFGIVLAVAVTLVPRTLALSSGGVSRYALIFQVGLAVIGMTARPSHRWQLVLLTLLAVGGFAVIAISNDNLRNQASIWLWALGPFNSAGLTMILAGASLVIAALINTGSPRPAGGLAIAAAPWGAMWAVELATNPMRYFEYPWPLCSVGLVTACGVAIGILRRRQRRRALQSNA